MATQKQLTAARKRADRKAKEAKASEAAKVLEAKEAAKAATSAEKADAAAAKAAAKEAAREIHVTSPKELARVKKLRQEKTHAARVRKLCQGNKTVQALFEENQALRARIADLEGKGGK